MNKEIFDQLPTDERPVAKKLNSISEGMEVPQDFQWTLESKLMDAYQSKSQPKINWFSKIIVPAGWAVAAVLGFVFLNWAIGSLASPDQINPATISTDIPDDNFETQVRQGDICRGRLAAAHRFSVAVSHEEKTSFILLNEDQAIGELRSFAWSKDGKQLAVLGNTTGNGNIYFFDSTSPTLYPVLSNIQTGYMMDFAWSHDGSKFAMWSGRNNTTMYLVNADSSDLQEVQLDVQILGTPQFTPDDESIFFLGGNTSAFGLFILTLKDLQTEIVSPLVEDETGFAWSPNGTQLAYFEMDRDLGEARLIVEEFASGTKSILGTLPIPQGSGSSIPDVANLSWSQDGTKLIFEFGRNAANRAIYLAYSDGSGLVKVVDSAYAPTISADGNCLAYISSKQVFITDLNSVLLSSSTPMLLADLPSGKGTSDFRLDKLQWGP